MYGIRHRISVLIDNQSVLVMFSLEIKGSPKSRSIWLDCIGGHRGSGGLPQPRGVQGGLWNDPPVWKKNHIYVLHSVKGCNLAEKLLGVMMSKSKQTITHLPVYKYEFD